MQALTLKRCFSFPNQGKKLISGLLLSEGPQHRGRDRGRMLLLNSAHHHTEVSGFNDNSNTERIDRTLQRFSDLSCQTLLHLQSTSKDIYESRDLAEPNHFALGDIGDMNLAEKRQKMVLAETEHLNVPDNHHFIIGQIEHRVQESFLWVLLVAPSQMLQGAFDAFGCSHQAVAIRILAQSDQHFSYEFRQTQTR